MGRLRALPCLLAFAIALPCMARADTVEVTMHASGAMYANPIVLHALDIDTGITDRLPFDLAISASFDPGSVTDGPYGPQASADETAVEMSFQLGDMRYHYAGTTRSYVVLYDAGNGRQGYRLEFGFGEVVGTQVDVSALVIAPAGSFGPDPLAPRSLGADPGFTGFVSFDTYSTSPDSPYFMSMNGDADRVSLQVTSPVPEPAPFGMLAAGVFILGGWRMRECLVRRAKQAHP